MTMNSPSGEVDLPEQKNRHFSYRSGGHFHVMKMTGGRLVEYI